jgi:hypothetical protein
VDPFKRRESVRRCSPLMVDDDGAWVKSGVSGNPLATGSGQEARGQGKGDAMLYCRGRMARERKGRRRHRNLILKPVKEENGGGGSDDNHMCERMGGGRRPTPALSQRARATCARLV